MTTPTVPAPAGLLVQEIAAPGTCRCFFGAVRSDRDIGIDRVPERVDLA